jgi:hypothetical protein
VIFNVRHELTSADLAYAVALDTEVERDGRMAQGIYIGSLTKTDIREIGRTRVVRSGLPQMWLEVEDDALIRLARERIDTLWPKGA